jgi:hypothetical protein
MMFPGAGAQVYYNEAGEPLGWDSADYDGPQDAFDAYNEEEDYDDDDLDEDE